MVQQLALDRRVREARERATPVGVIAVDRMHEREARDLKEVVPELRAERVPACELTRDRQRRTSASRVCCDGDRAWTRSRRWSATGRRGARADRRANRYAGGKPPRSASADCGPCIASLSLVMTCDPPYAARRRPDGG